MRLPWMCGSLGKREFAETKNVIGGLAYPAYKYGIILFTAPWERNSLHRVSAQGGNCNVQYAKMP